ncbi:hypothetical protein [Clostridium tetani]|uniref:hypothetical protein n=1 Tax=Clostridium tetani TaxID=1513 RepID=UPI00100BAC8F|nr:hypothetical protein [Clostridium tetani]RXM57309.1 hypothetical protein DP133_09355 [Clostridium tetani]RXM77171.1 hypothetical protein DP154_06455 [Clostridium tetani]RYU99416.1 hypothetical protein DP144_06465 [Clostridium tetani]
MNKVLKNIVNGAIENEFDRINYEVFLKSSEHQDQSQKQDEAREKLFEVVPKEYHEEFNKALDKYETELSIASGIEERYVFKQGVIQGLTDLKYLQELGLKISFI